MLRGDLERCAGGYRFVFVFFKNNQDFLLWSKVVLWCRVYKDIGCFKLRCHWQMSNKIVRRIVDWSARLIFTSQRAFWDYSLTWRIYWGDLSTVLGNTLRPYSVSTSIEWVSISTNVLLMLLWKAIHFCIVSTSFVFVDFEHNSKTSSRSSVIETNKSGENINKRPFKMTFHNNAQSAFLLLRVPGNQKWKAL